VFESYIRKGLLKHQRINWKQIEAQIHMAHRDVKTAEVVTAADPSWSLTMIYQALLRAGRALLMAHGVLPADGGQHKTVVDLVGQILGKEFSVPVSAFEKMRKKRNLFFYDSVESSTETEVKNAFRIARKIIRKIEEILKEENPQLRLNWEPKK
jgi:uncharacterized protein (UPF0332 family)